MSFARILACLVLLVAAISQPALAYKSGSPTVIVGIIPGAGWTGPTTQPANQGRQPATVTISNASPAVVTDSGGPLLACQIVEFSTSGALPTGLAVNTPYWVLNPSGSTYQLGATTTGTVATPCVSATAINTSSSGSGTHTGQIVGASANAIAAWDFVPYQLMSGTFQLCVDAKHINGIAKVSFAADGGSFSDITTPTTFGPASPVAEYCAYVNTSNYADGQHEFRAIVYPINGIPRVLQSGGIATATANNNQFAAPAHGQFSHKSVVTSGGSGVGVPDGTYFIARASTPLPGTFQLSTTNPAETSKVPVSLANPPVATLANTFTAGQTFIFSSTYVASISPHFYTGLSLGQTYFVCATGLTTSSFAFSDTLADANGACTDLTASGSDNSNVTTVWPIVVPSGSGTFNFAYAFAGGNEAQVTQGESMFLSTNKNGTLLPATAAAYVDSVAGADSGSCPISAPCATIHFAKLALVPLQNGAAFTVTNGSKNITRTGQAFQVNQMVTVTGTPPTPFALNTNYWVVSSTTNTVQLAATPGGSAIQATASGNMGVLVDLSFENVYLMCDSPCSSPSTYALSAATENTPLTNQQGWLNVGPAPGTLASNTLITSSLSGNGVRASKVHLTANIQSQLVTLTTNADSPQGQGVLNFAAGTVGLLASGTWYISAGAGCAPEGRSASSEVFPVTVIGNNGTGAVTLQNSALMWADCPNGTSITFTNTFISGVGVDFWFDSATASGPGQNMNQSEPIALSTQYSGGIWVTNATIKNYWAATYPSTFDRNVTATSLGAVDFNNTPVILNSTATNTGIDVTYSLVTTAGFNAGLPTTLQFTPGSLPADLTVGWQLLSSGTCNAVTSVAGFNNAAGTIKLVANVPGGCTVGSTVVLGTGFHTDWAFSTGGGVNQLIDGSSAGANVITEDFFFQGAASWDVAMYNSSLSALSYGTLTLETPITNLFLNGVTIKVGTVTFRSDLGYVAVDNVFANNICNVANSIAKNGAQGTLPGIVNFGSGGC